MLDWADAVYVRAHPRLERALLPQLARVRKPVVWEINAPCYESWWAARLEGRRLLPTRTEWQRRYEAAKCQRLRPRFADRVAAAICVSERLAAYARAEIGLTNVRVVPNGSDPDLFRPDRRNRSSLQWSDRDFVIAWAGSADYPWHDLPRVFKVAEECAGRFPTWRFAFLCDRSQLPRSLPASVIFAERLDYFAVPTYLASADVGLCLYRGIQFSKWGNYFSPLKLFDYLASGLPVIASDKGQASDLVGQHECGLVVDDSTEALVEALTNIEGGRARAAQMGSNGRGAIQALYNWDRVTAETLDVLRAVVA
jgi:glycosyltransferase involved in cell wall biosynthesis